MPKPMAHVFIVNENTFPVHLEYQFAGTTAGPRIQKSISLYADIARVRLGDRVYFYLLRKGFYGPFKVSQIQSNLNNQTNNTDLNNREIWWDKLNPTFLQERLRLRLIYRVGVINDNTYPLGVSEWDSLDKYLRDPEKCLWSLVYRKLKGERGCTMIFPWEDDFLLKLIEEQNVSNGRSPIQCKPDEHLTWDQDKSEIVVASGAFPTYDPPSFDHCSPPEDPASQIRSHSGSEMHLQAFLTRNYGRFSDSELIFGERSSLVWVGNEVACGLGMQKMDLFVINEEQSSYTFKIIELKKEPPNEGTVLQFNRYIDWTKQFVKGANSSNIQPILLCRNLRKSSLARNIIDSFKRFNSGNYARPILYIECSIDEFSNEIHFYKVDY